MKILTTVNYNSSNIISNYLEEKSSQTVIYNGSTIATISPGASGTLLTSGKQCNSNITIGGKTLVTNGKLLNSNIGISVVKYSRLPAGYTETEYTQASGNSYFNSGLTTSADMGFQSVGMYNGNCTATCGAVYWSNHQYNTTKSEVYWGSGQYFSTTINQNTKYTVELNYNNSKQAKWNGSAQKTLSGSPTLNVPIWVFGLYYNGSLYMPLVGRIYSCKITNGTTLVRDFVPCKNSSNVAGMFDIINNQFYSSATSTAFTAGPEV